MHVITSANDLLERLERPIREATPAPSKPVRSHGVVSAARWFARCVDRGDGVRSGIAALDALAPGGAFARGAVHEVLNAAALPPLLLPILLARAAVLPRREPGALSHEAWHGTQHQLPAGWIVWCDPAGTLYPPALAALGIPLHRLLVLRPTDIASGLWAIVQCLRCPGVCACVASMSRLSRVEARRFQLAAETGNSLGLLLRPAAARAWPYAAATRWLVSPAPGRRLAQRWSMQLIHGHGGCVGKSVLVELCRETYRIQAIDPRDQRGKEYRVTFG